MAKNNLQVSLIFGSVITLIFIVFSYGGLSIIDGIETYVYDTEMKLSLSEKQDGNKLLLIEIDDKSLGELGSWPWPRHLAAEMINILKKSEPKLIGLNVPLIEKEPNQGIKEIRTFREKFKAHPNVKKRATLATWILENLRQIEEGLDNDSRLVESVKQSGNVILPFFGQLGDNQGRAKKNEGPYLFKNSLTPHKTSDSPNKRLTTKMLSLPFMDLGQNVLGMGHGNITLEGNMIGRSHPMFIRYKGALLPSFPLRLAIAYLNQQPQKVYVEKNQIQLKGYSIPTIKGEMLIKFKGKKGSFTRYSFADILHAKQKLPMLKGKIILVGFNHRESRRIPTSISPDMSETELTACILDNIINKNFIRRPPILGYIEILAILILGGFASFFFPRMGWLSRLGGIVGMTLLTLMAGMILFYMMGIWLKISYIASCLILIYVTVSVTLVFTGGSVTKDSTETNRMLGLGFQSQGLLDLAFDKFRKLPLDKDAKDLIYTLGLEYERKQKIKEALSAFEYVNRGGGFRDLDERIAKLRDSVESSLLEGDGALTDSTGETRSRVGRYEILGELGKGSKGLVYKATDPKINRLLAIKTIRFSDEFDDDVLQEIKERFFREAEIAGKLSHPSIVTIHDVGDDRELTYMAMEYLEGQDLDKFIQKGNLLPFRKVLDMVSRVADALDFAHKAEVIHRDIKPANIMLLKNGEVKVTDFGIAKAISSSRTRTGVILGTPNYMSPEQIMGQKIDARSDIFSLGVVFFQLLTGQLPFRGDNLSNLLYQITHAKHPSVRNFNPKIPKACEQIIDKALAKKPDQRFSIAGDMAKVIRLLVSRMDQLKKKKPVNNN